ncbi:hypothetical protein Tco_0876737 [Tanacetum coccineum]|uniref:Uncharacterized protein n=1 Tax=Tanacetum coccineum TaxID=301880 RepID=A0ABQ5BVV2_9ASTR
MLDAALVPINEQVKIASNNFRIALEKTLADVIYKVCLKILKQYSFYNAFNATADAHEIYVQQFWYTITYDLTAKAFFFTMGDQVFEVNVDLLHNALRITPKDPDHPFTLLWHQITIAVIMEYLVNISKWHAFWSLNEDILKINVLTTNTPYPSRKIRRICACTHQRARRIHDQYAVSKEDQYADEVPPKSKNDMPLQSNECHMMVMMIWDMIHLMLHLLNGDDEVELTDEEFFDNEDEVAKTYLLRTLRDSRLMKNIRMIGSMNGTKIYHSLHCWESLHYQDLEWYNALKDSKLKEEALRNKAIMEGLIDEVDESSNNGWRR